MEKANFDAARERLSARVTKQHQRKRRLQAEEARYTLVLHAARKRLGVSINEYCLADTIHKLSSNRSSVPGWCFASKERLAQALGFSRRSIHSMINRLKELNLLEVHEETGYLRTTDTWREAVEVVKNGFFQDHKGQD